MLAVDVLERDPAGRLASDHERHVDGRLHHLALEDRAAEFLEPFRQTVVQNDGLARLEDVFRHTHNLVGLVGKSFAALDRVPRVHQPVFTVHQPDVDDLRVEDLPDPIPDEVVHRLHVKALGETTLDVVDQRELGVPLPRLLEQPGVLQRDDQ